MPTIPTPPLADRCGITLGEMRAELAARGGRKTPAGMLLAAFIRLMETLVALIVAFQEGRLAAPAPGNDGAGHGRVITSRAGTVRDPAHDAPGSGAGAMHHSPSGERNSSRSGSGRRRIGCGPSCTATPRSSSPSAVQTLHRGGRRDAQRRALAMPRGLAIAPAPAAGGAGIFGADSKKWGFGLRSCRDIIVPLSQRHRKSVKLNLRHGHPDRWRTAQ